MSIRLKSITVQDYRCFGGPQTVRLAPITLLVGENSSGKTSLLAMIRALWDSAFTPYAGTPDSKEPPFDLGSFDEILHRGSRNRRFMAGFDLDYSVDEKTTTYKVEVEFVPGWGQPVLSRRRYSNSGCWIEQRMEETGDTIQYGTPNGSWSNTMMKVKFEEVPPSERGLAAAPPISLHHMFVQQMYHREEALSLSSFAPLEDSPRISKRDIEYIDKSLGDILDLEQKLRIHSSRPLASAPVRSRPKRTYDPDKVAPDAEGDYIPMYLGKLSQLKPEIWNVLKKRIEKFGKVASLFNVLDFNHLGNTAGAPFQIKVGTFYSNQDDEPYNLADVGYGVSQVLPLITELLRDNGPQLILLQQPEVHLHPSAQAALGNLLCEMVGSGRSEGRQIIVETHSDFIINRVRMAARDKVAGLQPEDISIIYFERGDHNVKMHTMRVDHEGNLLDAPPGYRQFFMKESQWFLGK